MHANHRRQGLSTRAKGGGTDDIVRQTRLMSCRSNGGGCANAVGRHHTVLGLGEIERYGLMHLAYKVSVSVARLHIHSNDTSEAIETFFAQPPLT